MRIPGRVRNTAPGGAARGRARAGLPSSSRRSLDGRRRAYRADPAPPRRSLDGVRLGRQPERGSVPRQIGRHAVETFIERRDCDCPVGARAHETVQKQNRRAIRITGDGITQPGHGLRRESLPTAPDAASETRFAAVKPAKVKSLVGPFKLEFDLLFVAVSFVLNVELGTSGHVDPFSGHLYLESLTRLEGVCQPAQLRYELGRGVNLLDVPVLLFAHRVSPGSLND